MALLALVVFGPEKLPDIARTIGRTISEVRRMADDARSEFRAGFDDPIDRDPVADEPMSPGPIDPGSPATTGSAEEAHADADAAAPDRGV